MRFFGFKPLTLWRSCFGLCLPDAYTALKKDDDKIVPDAPLKEKEKAKPKTKEKRRPQSNWRDIPLVSNYTLIKQIGKGGFSTIWLAENVVSTEKVALKVVYLKDEDLEPEEVTTLLFEAKVLRTLDCPYLIKCYDTAATDDWLILALEYLSGGEMLDHIQSVRKYTEAGAAKLFAQVVSAISYLHNLNVIHRDIKPENVMFTMRVEESEAQGQPLRVKVIDLGMAMVYDANKEVRGCIGTPGFVAPEIWNDGPHTPASDVYSLGVVLFIMLTGRKPHRGIDIRMMTYCNKSIMDAPGLKDERFLALSSAARDLLLKMLADDPRDRPTCAAVLKHPFITTVDTNVDAQREMGDMVRRRIRDLAQLRRVHGLRYALRVQKPQGADHQAFLEVLDQRRLKIKRELATSGKPSESALGRPSDASGFATPSDAGFGRPSEGCGAGPYARASLAACYGVPSAALAGPLEGCGAGGGGGGAGAGGPFARCSLAASYAMPPAVLAGPLRDNLLPPGVPDTWTPATATPALPIRAPSTAPHHGTAAATAAASSAPAASSPARPPRPSASGFVPASTSTSSFASAHAHARAFAAPFAAAVAAQPASASGPGSAARSTEVQVSLPHGALSSPTLPSFAAASVPAYSPSGTLTPAPGAAEGAGRAAITPTRAASRSLGGANSSSPDLFFHDMGIPVADHLAARPRHCPGSGVEASGGARRSALPLSRDPLGVANVLPSLHQCLSMNAAAQLEYDDEEDRPGGAGGSPVATAAVLEQALLARCMSANQFTLELLGREASMQRVLSQAEPGLGGSSMLLVAAAAAVEAKQLSSQFSSIKDPQQHQQQQQQHPQGEAWGPGPGPPSGATPGLVPGPDAAGPLAVTHLHAW